MMFGNEDHLGAVLVQVQEDLKQLKSSLEQITLSQSFEALDIQALDNAITRTQESIRKHGEEYLKAVSNQLLILPCIQDFHTQTAPNTEWKPSLENLPDLPPERKDQQGPSPGKKTEKEKAAPGKKKGIPGDSSSQITLTKKIPPQKVLLCNPSNSSNEALFHQKPERSLPDVHKRSKNTEKGLRKVSSSVQSQQAAEPKKRHIPVVGKEDMNTVPNLRLLNLSIQQKNVLLHSRKDVVSSKTGSKSRYHQQIKLETEPESTRTESECSPVWTAKTPPPSTVSRSMDQRDVAGDTDSPESPVASVSLDAPRFSFTIIKGQIDPRAADFCHFKRHFILCWSSVVDALEALKKLLRDFAVPLARVDGELLVKLSHGWSGDFIGKPPSALSLLSALQNQEEVLGVVSRPGQRFRGEGGVEAAAIHIQSCWRRHTVRTAYLRRCRLKWAAGVMAISWMMRAQMRQVRKALQARRISQLENYRSRAQHLAANWKQIQTSKRTIIHIPSLGYSHRQRLKLVDFEILQNTQISRVFETRDENVEVIYICPQHLGDDVLGYYTSLLKCDGAADGAEIRATQASSCTTRFIILTPEAVDYFPTHNMCLSTLLKYSPHTLKRIKNLIQGKCAYIVGRVAHVDDLAVADELGVPILGPEPAVAQLYSTKSGGRKILAGADVDIPPGRGDINSLNQLYETLAELMVRNMAVQRWLFKVDGEHGARGTAYCDVCHLSSYKWALKEYHRYGPELWNTESVQGPVLRRYLHEIPEWLAQYARPAKTSVYPKWACFLKTFLRQGGVLEADPPSDSVTCLTVDLLLDPEGEVTMLSCGDQLHGSCPLEAVGSTVPQTSVHPETLHSICMRVGRACVQRLVMGYVCVHLATFVDRSTLEQKVWAVDLDIAYSDQLAMTHMLLMITGGTLDCRSGCLEVPITEESGKHKTTVERPVSERYAVIGSHLFHSNLAMFYHHVFLKMCNFQGIRFNKKRKQGTAFALYDCSKRYSIGMIQVSEDLRGALVTFAQNLSVIHQEISSSRIQGETNFKALIKEIEHVLQMTAQDNK